MNVGIDGLEFLSDSFNFPHPSHIFILINLSQAFQFHLSEVCKSKIGVQNICMVLFSFLRFKTAVSFGLLCVIWVKGSPKTRDFPNI